jgi:hypothetical protein
MATAGNLEPLSDEDLRQATDLETQVVQWFADGHDSVVVNGAGIPERIMEELLRRASRAGWKASYRGILVNIKK